MSLRRLTSLRLLNVANTNELDCLSELSNLRSIDLSFIEMHQPLTELRDLPLSLERVSINLVPVSVAIFAKKYTLSSLLTHVLLD